MDVNCDMAELPELAASGVQDALLAVVSSVNVACGSHAGDADLMEQTMRAAARHGVAVGAHPGYPDREHFGRMPMNLSREDLMGSLEQQLRLAASIAGACGISIRHIKPHGALYNQAAHDERLALVVAEAAQRVLPGVPLMMLAGSPAVAVLQAAGLTVIPEAFADRAYEADGSLRNRRLPGALIEDPATAARQALGIARDGLVVASSGETVSLRACSLCIHSDTPGAPAIARAVRESLEAAGLRVEPAIP